MPPGDVPLPDSLVPGNGAVRPTLNTSGQGGSFQKQTPTSPADSNRTFDSPRARSGGRNGSAVTSPVDGMQNPDGRTGRRLDSNNPGQRDPSTPRDRAGYWEKSAQCDRPSQSGRLPTKSPGSSRICKKCGEPLTGQFVRALGATYHLECFKCEVSLVVHLNETRRVLLANCLCNRIAGKLWHLSSFLSTLRTEADSIHCVRQITFGDWTSSATNVAALCVVPISPP